jgi:hypothetical protein
MNEPSSDELQFYSTPGPMTSFAEVERRQPEVVAGLPTDPAGVAEVVQGLVLHQFLGSLYDVDVSPLPEGDVQLRSAAAIVERLLGKDPRPLVEARAPADRFFGNCRHFSTLTVAMLRRAGVPSRARCGFGGYFLEGKWVDHWVVEHWDGQRWLQLDAQIDDVQRALRPPGFDPTDLAPGLFLTGGDAWQRSRDGREQGDDFGIADLWGQWFIPGNVARDLASLNKVEMLPWDAWGALAPADADDHAVDEPLVDELAAVATSGDFAAIRARYEADDVRVPPRVLVLATTRGPQVVDVPELDDALLTERSQ